MEFTLDAGGSSISTLNSYLVIGDPEYETSIPFREKGKTAHPYSRRAVGICKIDDRRTALRVRDFSVSGALLVTEETIPVGTRLKLLFSVPEGEIRILAVVRSFAPSRGIGVEFVGIESRAFDLVRKLVKRLLA
jgi:hypothetical protein